MSDIEGSEPDWQLAAMIAVSECGQRASFKEKVRSSFEERVCRGVRLKSV